MFVFVRLFLRITALILLCDGLAFNSPGLASLVLRSSVGKLMFLTILSCIFAVITLLLMQIKDFLGKRPAQPLLFVLAKKMLALSLCFNTIVFCLFWPLFFYDESLLAPKELIVKAGG
jgi:hypothetical protein